MKNKKNIVIILLLISIIIIGFTVAYFTNQQTVENDFNTSKFETTTYETFISPTNWAPGDTISKKVYVTNDGDVDAAVRISYAEEWKDSDGTTLSNIQNSENIAVINLTNKKDWIKIGNYYYYKYRLPVGDSTSTFMDSVTFNSDIDYSSDCETVNGITSCKYSIGDYEGATYTLSIKTETIQFKKYNDIWNTDLVLADEKPLTGIEIGTDNLVKKSNPASVTDYTDGNMHEMYEFNHDATEQTPALTDYRYIGNDPYNYVYFNCDEPQEGVEYNYADSCEVWRILGVFDVDDGNGNIEQRMKLVRGNSLPTKMKWNNEPKNDWTTASLKIFLNEDYYNNTGDALTDGYGLKKSAREMIDDAKYYLGGRYVFQTQYGTTDEIYTWERGNTLCEACNGDTSKLSWTGKVALMYPSDEYMVYGKGVNEICYDDPNSCRATKAYTGWVYNSNNREGQTSPENMWLLSNMNQSGFAYSVFDVYSNGFLSYGSGNTYSNAIRPVVYLSKNVTIKSGTGKESDPYKLVINYTASEYLIKNAANEPASTYSTETKGNMFVFNHGQTDQTDALTDYRYIGDSPNNYANFNCDNDGNNCETWRIVGVFNVDDGNGNYKQRVKLVRGNSFAEKMKWNVNEPSDWTLASLKNFLNSDYYNRSGNALSYGLKDIARNMIDKGVYYLGGRTFNETLHYGNSETIYTWERGTDTYNNSRATRWTGNVGLMYPSDVYMIYGKGVNDTCYNDPYNCDNQTIASLGWIYNSNIPEGDSSVAYTWLISQGYLDVSNAYYSMSQGQLYFGHVNNGVFGVRPVIYLDADVKIKEGTGEAGSPYIFTY